MNQLRDLFLQSRHQFRVIVSQTIHGNAGQRVQIASPLRIGEPNAFAVRKRNRQTVKYRHEVGSSGIRHSYSTSLNNKKRKWTAALTNIRPSKVSPMTADHHSAPSQRSIIGKNPRKRKYLARSKRIEREFEAR